MSDMNQQVDALILLEVPEEEIVNRILKRGKDSNRSDDSDEDVIPMVSAYTSPKQLRSTTTMIREEKHLRSPASVRLMKYS